MSFQYQGKLNFNLKLKRTPIHQAGTAIVVAMFIMTLVASIAIAMAERQQIDIRRTEQLILSDQAYLYAAGVKYWALGLLRQNVQSSAIADKPPLLWPQRLPATQHGDMLVNGTLNDLQGRFNINNITKPEYAVIFKRLMQNLAPDQAVNANDITAAITRWISPIDPSAIANNSSNNLNSATNNDEYAQANPPYQTAHQKMVSVSELRLISGVTADLYLKLAPYLSALPEITPININSASMPVLAALGNSSMDVAGILNTRANGQAFTTVNAFLQATKNANISPATVTVNSTYYLLQADVILGEQHLILYTLLKAALLDKQLVIMPLRESQGEF